MLDSALWQKCIEFHGHECPGLAVGYAAAMATREILGMTFSSDEEITCVCENDACGIDAIQVVLGCSVGKGNLLIKLNGKQVFTIFDRRSGNSVRLSLRTDVRQTETRQQKIEMLLNSPWQELFVSGKPKFELPEPARIFKSHPCSLCKELTAEFALHVCSGQLLCNDCYEPYSRGW